MDLDALQADVVSYVGNTAALIGQTLEVLRGENDRESEVLTGEQAAIKGDVLHSVQQLELRLPIVATMKAGKSTLINGIAGFGLLPSRELPMTMLPTEVVLTTGVAEPRLEFPEAVMELLRRVAGALSGNVTSAADAGQQLANDKSFKDTLDALARGDDAVPPGEAHGVDDINSALSRANDLTRLGVQHQIIDDLITHLDQLPRIVCPPPGELKGIIEGRAKLVLVDTPGPNEAEMRTQLRPLIDRELNAASVIFLVLNFTDMLSQAQRELIRQIKPTLDLLGSGKIHVVVNRWDEWKRKGMGPEETKRFAATEAGLSPADDLGKVYLTSAWWALVASSFQRAWREFGETAWDKPEGQDLGQAAHPVDWDEQKGSYSPEYLRELPGNMWRRSGFEELLGQAVAELQRQAGPLILESALDRCQGIIDQLRQRLLVRQAAVNATIKSLLKEQAELQHDLSEVKKARKDLRASGRPRRALQKQVGSVIDEQGRDVGTAIDHVLSEISREETGLRIPAPPDSFRFVGRPARDLPDSMASRLTQNGKQAWEFDSQDEAAAFIAEVQNRVLAEIGVMDRFLQDEVPRLVQQAEDQLGEEIHSRAKPIAEAAQQRIAESFRVTLELPVPDFKNIAEDFTPPAIRDPLSHAIIQAGTEIVRRRRWYVLWLFKRPQSQPITVLGQPKYIYDLGAIAGDYRTQFNRWLAQNRKNILDEAGHDLDDSLHAYFRELGLFLERYLASIQAGIKHRQADHDKRRRLREAFGGIVADADMLITHGEKKLEYVREFIAAAKAADGGSGDG